jgi:hypothetical protein
MRKVLLLAITLLTLPAAAMGDIVVLKNGSRFEGVVTEHKDSFEVDIGCGKVEIPKRLVKQVIKCDTPRQKFEKKSAATDQTDVEQLTTLKEWCTRNGLKKEAKELALKIGELTLKEKSTGLDMKDSAALFDFALWCQRNGYESSVVESFLWKVLTLEPDHKMAREMLGYGRFRSQWLKKDEIAAIRRAEYEKEMRTKGMVKYNGQWLMPAAAAYLKKLEDVEDQREELERDRRRLEDDQRKLDSERAELEAARNSLYAGQSRLRRRENILERTAMRQVALARQLAGDQAYVTRLKIELRNLKEDIEREKDELREERDELEKEKLRVAQLRCRLECEWRKLRQQQREKKDCRPEAERPKEAKKAKKGSEEHTPGRQPYSNRDQQLSRRRRVRR